MFSNVELGPLADLRGCEGRVPPLGVQILSISFSYGENLAKSYVGAPLGSRRPLLGEILDPPLWSELNSTLILFRELLKRFQWDRDCIWKSWIRHWFCNRVYVYVIFQAVRAYWTSSSC